jgi:hypothetical protein
MPPDRIVQRVIVADVYDPVMSNLCWVGTIQQNTSGSIQWAYKPGTAKNSNGQPINPDGSLVTNPATSGTGSGVANPVVTSSPGYDWSISVNPLPFCSAEVDVDDEDGNLLLGSIGFFPCP